MKKTYVYREGKAVEVRRTVDLFGNPIFEEPIKPLPPQINWDKARREFELFMCGGAVGHSYRHGTYRL